MDREAIKYILTDFHTKKLPPVVERDLRLPLDLEKVVSLVGIRRSGKTSLLYGTMQQLLDDGVDKRNILYLNFEDDRLFPIQLSQMDLLLRAFHELYPEKTDQRKYLFLDEIHQVENWEKYVRRVYDTENVRIFITGSSSRLVSKEIAGALRGRTITFEVFPLSFGEFLRFRGVEVRYYDPAQEARILHALNEYLFWGGFPEVVKSEDDFIRGKILQEYADLILYKDLIEQYGIQNQYLLKYLLKHFMVNAAALFSVNRIYNDLKSRGVSASKNALYEYVEYLRAAYILFSTPKYSDSIRVQAQNPTKNYVIDTGLMQAFQADPRGDVGRKLENAVFLHLRRSEKGRQIFYYKNRHDIDFVVSGKAGRQLINVSYDINTPDTAKREYRGLTETHSTLPAAKRVLVANSWTPDLLPRDVEVSPAWQFLVH